VGGRPCKDGDEKQQEKKRFFPLEFALLLKVKIHHLKTIKVKF